jgi:hypothetical protein
VASNQAYLATNYRVGFLENRGRKAFSFRSLNSFKVESSWRNLTDKAEFIVAKQLCFADQKKVFDYVKVGDPFFIEAGYNGEFNRYFTGFITEIQDDLPVLFKGEDNMYILKRTPVNHSSNGIMLTDLLKKIIPSRFKIVAPAGIKLGKLLYQARTFDTAASVLQDLKKWGLYSFFRGDTLTCVSVHSISDRRVKYTFYKNVLPGNDLRYRKKDDIRVKVTMKSYISGGKVLKVVVGDKDGINQELADFDNTDVASLTKLAENELARFKVDGLTGSITGFGIPFVQHGDTVELKHPQNSDKTGNYYADGVTTTGDDRGAIRNIVTLGRRAS